MIPITKCADTSCPSRASCWRFAAPALPEQQFKMFARRNGETLCNDYVHVTDQEKRRGGPKSLEVIA